MTTFEKDGDMPDKGTNFFPSTHQVLSYNSETGAKRFKKSKAPMNHFCNNGKLTLAKILEKSRLICIFIISHLYASKSPHFVIFHVWLRAQATGYDSENGNKRFKKSEAPMSHFSNRGKIAAHKNREQKLIHLYHHDKLSVCIKIATFCYIPGAIKGPDS